MGDIEVSEDAPTVLGGDDSPSSDRADVPERVGRYAVLGLLGAGGMGSVLRGWDPELDRPVAIKVIQTSSARYTDSYRQRLIREAQALAALSHPNVVNVFEVGEHGRGVFVAMELVAGPTLLQWTRQTTRPWAQILAMYIQAGRGLSAAHAKGIVHRDFKPANVIVGDDGRARVLDFGLAVADGTVSLSAADVSASSDEVPLAGSISNPLTEAGVVMGTPAYMAPEQHLGEPADARSDQFAFAVALFEGLTGRLPFAGDDLRTLSLSVVRGKWDPPPPGVMAAEIQAVLARALQVDPNDRFASIDELLAALTTAVNTADPRFDTRGVDQVLARAAELSAAPSSRPGLSTTEIEEIAQEVGISPEHARQAAKEALAPVAAQPALPVRAAAAPLVISDEPEPTIDHRVSVTRRIPRIRPEVAALLIREMERREGRGKTASLGASTTWQTSKMEMHIDPSGSETQLVLAKQLGYLAKTRAIRYAALGFILGVATIVPFAVEIFGDFEGLIVLIVFSSMFAGGFGGMKVAKKVDALHEGRVRQALESTVGRLTAIAEANS